MNHEYQVGPPPITPRPPAPPAPALAVGRKEAASMLGISERLLWSWTKLKRIPHVRMGARVLYPVHLLREWLQKNTRSAAE